MADPTSSPVYPPATDADGKLVLSSEEARALLRECFAQFRSAMIDMLHTSIETTNDLFETNPHVNDADVVDFRSRRGEWVKGFDAAIQELFEKRLAGEHRHGRRPDADRSLASLRVLNAFDQEKQLALTHAARFLYRLAKREPSEPLNSASG